MTRTGWVSVARDHYRQLPLPTLLNSMVLSRRHAPGHELPLPIVGPPGSAVHRVPGSRLELGGHLFLGWIPDRGRRPWKGGVPSQGPAMIGLGEAGRLSTGGWVVCGPGVRVSVHDGASVELGEGAYLNFSVQIVCNERVTIGPSVGIGWQSQIVDSDQHHLVVGGKAGPMSAPVVIGEGAWIGARCTILKGVTIGEGAVVGAGSIVRSNVPARCLAVGNPAQVVREDVSWY